MLHRAFVIALLALVTAGCGSTPLAPSALTPANPATLSATPSPLATFTGVVPLHSTRCHWLTLSQGGTLRAELRWTGEAGLELVLLRRRELFVNGEQQWETLARAPLNDPTLTLQVSPGDYCACINASWGRLDEQPYTLTLSAF